MIAACAEAALRTNASVAAAPNLRMSCIRVKSSWLPAGVEPMLVPLRALRESPCCAIAIPRSRRFSFGSRASAGVRPARKSGSHQPLVLRRLLLDVVDDEHRMGALPSFELQAKLFL